MQVLKQIHQLDVLTFYWCMARKRRQHLTRLGRVVSFTADGPLYAIIGVFLYLQQDDQWLQALVMAFIAERLLYLIIKQGFKRNRPAQSLVDFHSFISPSDQFSFPSGHTSGAFLMAFFLTQWYPEWSVVWYSWAMSVGLSRIFLGVHFPTDTLMGALLGTSCAAAVIGVMLV